MKEELKNILEFQDQPFRVPVLVYESVDEADKAAGFTGAMCKKGNDHMHLHGSAGDCRDLVVECVQEMTKVPFLTVTTKEKNDAGVEVEVTERDYDKDSDAKYVKRALALKSVDRASLQSLIETRARGYKAKDDKGVEIVIPPIAVNIKATVRTGPKTKTLAKKFREVAMEFLSGKKNLKKFSEVLTKQEIGTFVPVKDVPLTDEANVVALGWLCKAWSDAQDVFKAVS